MHWQVVLVLPFLSFPHPVESWCPCQYSAFYPKVLAG
jgi:hypothetical protein